MTNYVLDTNVILEDCNVLKNLENATVNIPLIVLKEIDNNKTQMGEVGFNARSFSKILDGLNFSSYNDIIKYSDNLNIRFVTLPTANDLIPDDQIIEIAKNINNITNDVILLSNDINVRVKAKLAGLESKPYSKSNINKDDLYTGIRNIYTDSLIIDSLHSHGSLSMDLDDVSPNEYVHLISNQNEKHTALAKLGSNNTLFKVKSVKSITGIKPKNLEQACAIDLILNNEIALATLMGNAGSGKTLIALASALYLVGSGQYQKLVIIRPPIPMGKDIGFLPGSLEEKMMVWMGPILDNLEMLEDGNKKLDIEYLLNAGALEIAPPTFIRGRSIANSIVLVDEAQSLTIHEVKTIVTRIHSSSKLIFTGDIRQIDNNKLSMTDNGFSQLVQAFKDQPLSGHITLNKCERSSLAEIASQIL